MTFNLPHSAARLAAIALVAGCSGLAGCTEQDLEDGQAQHKQESTVASTMRASTDPAPAADASLRLPGVPAFDVTDSGGALHVLFAKPLDSDAKAIQLYHVRSDDAGATWTQSVAIPVAHAPPARAQRGDDPQVAARGGRLMALWTAQGEGPFGSGPIACALSDDDGRTWRAGPVAPDAEPLPPSATPAKSAAPQPAASSESADAAARPQAPGAGKSHGHGGMKSAAKGTGPGYRFPAAAAGGEAFHVVWIHAIGEERSLRHSRLPFGSTKWSEPKIVDPEICACCWNELKVAPDGRLITLYRDVKPSDMVLATSGDGGKTWHSAGRAGGFDWQFDGCPHVGGGIATTGTGSHSDASEILASVWTGDSSDTGAYCVSLDPSGSWSRPSPLAFADGRGRNTDVAALGNARCATVWDQVMPEGGQAVFAAFSTDAGKTWSEPRRVSSEGVNTAYPRVVPAGDQYLVLWTTYGAEGETALGSTLVKP